MMGEALNNAGGAAGEPVPALQPKPEDAPAGGEGAATVEVDEWYKDSAGSNFHRSSLMNADGLRLATYRWDPQDTVLRGKIVLIHGYAVHARFEYLRHDLEHPEEPPKYAESWIQRLAAAGFSVHALDQQSFGASEGMKGKRAHVVDFDALPRDIIQFLYEQVLPSHNSTAPIFLCGISMGGCAVARAVELLAGGHTRSRCCGSHVSSHSAGEEDEEEKPATVEAETTEQQQTKEKKKQKEHKHENTDEDKQKQEKVLLPLKGLICLAPMFSLDRMKKKNRLLLPFAKMLATLSPTLEIAKAAKNPMYPAFDTLMKNDPLCYNGKSRARLSYELLYAVSAVQQQAHYLAFPDAAVLTPHSTEPYPVYIRQAPALLIVESKNDTFVDPEGSIYVAAVVHAKMEASAETLEKFLPYYETVKATSKGEGQSDATLWMLDDLWHCFTKELPESDALLDRIINTWLLPHAAAADSVAATAPLPQEKNGKCAGADACAVASSASKTAVKKREEEPRGAAPIEITAARQDEETTAAAATEKLPSGSPPEHKHEEEKKETTSITGGDTTGKNAGKTIDAAVGEGTDTKVIPVGSHEKVENAAEKQKVEPQEAVQSAEPEAPAPAAASEATETATVEEKAQEQRNSTGTPVAADAADPPAAVKESSRPASGTEEEEAKRSAQQQQTGEEEKPAATEGSHGEERNKQLQETSETSGPPDAETAGQTGVEENKEQQQQQPPQEEKTEAGGTQDEQPVKQEGKAGEAAEDGNPESAAPQATEDRGSTPEI